MVHANMVIVVNGATKRGEDEMLAARFVIELMMKIEEDEKGKKKNFKIENDSLCLLIAANLLIYSKLPVYQP